MASFFVPHFDVEYGYIDKLAASPDAIDKPSGSAKVVEFEIRVWSGPVSACHGHGLRKNFQGPGQLFRPVALETIDRGETSSNGPCFDERFCASGHDGRPVDQDKQRSVITNR
ncbi:uncharacterized protein N0V89_010348 [Didymosphaeria variabile]|uniref:Uncharacterized protein n=1 Tax=Didymosphaeria variabile TaxID=1932322 RepID=A0A9W8XB46_9PLEO|nr:uncharacterized protein N0V89_010348 [Didymosphaeria variabile]KAJ4346419.1 hypothetical protein N0V89_010348 [Didymosphaeria variabile]